MDYALARASENGVERVTLDVWAFNASALRFYERLGFIPTKIRMAREL
jgi:ribosomal protein S18 acetylase RimI-like enzyme